MSVNLKAVPNLKELARFYRRIFLWGFPQEKDMAQGIYIPLSASTYTARAEDLEIPATASRYSISLNLSDRTSVGIAYAFIGAHGWVVSAFHEDCSFSRLYGQQSNARLISDLHWGLGAKSSIAHLAIGIFETCFPHSDQQGGYGLFMNRLEAVHLHEERRFFGL
jgi:hypothetical protein